MPEFRQQSEITVDGRGEGWTVSTLADHRHVAGMAMAARVWRLDAGASGPEQTSDGAAERFLYVVSGSGSFESGGRSNELGREDVVWIEPGDSFRLHAAAGEPLTVLDATSA